MGDPIKIYDAGDAITIFARFAEELPSDFDPYEFTEVATDPTSATVTVTDPTGTIKVNAGSMAKINTSASANGLWSHTFQTTSTWAAGEYTVSVAPVSGSYTGNKENILFRLK